MDSRLLSLLEAEPDAVDVNDLAGFLGVSASDAKDALKALLTDHRVELKFGEAVRVKAKAAEVAGELTSTATAASCSCCQPKVGSCFCCQKRCAATCNCCRKKQIAAEQADLSNEESVLNSLVLSVGIICHTNLRDQSGLSRHQFRSALRSLEQKKVIRAVKSADTTNKRYVRYDAVVLVRSASGGDFYVDCPTTHDAVQSAHRRLHPMRLYVKNMTLPEKPTLTLDVEAFDTVESVKAKIYRKEPFPPSEQSLQFADTYLEDGRTLAFYNITEESTLQLTHSYYTFTFDFGYEKKTLEFFSTESAERVYNMMESAKKYDEEMAAFQAGQLHRRWRSLDGLERGLPTWFSTPTSEATPTSIATPTSEATPTSMSSYGKDLCSVSATLAVLRKIAAAHSGMAGTLPVACPVKRDDSPTAVRITLRVLREIVEEYKESIDGEKVIEFSAFPVLYGPSK